MDKRPIIGASLGYTGIEAILCDGDFNILERQKKDFPGKVGRDSLVARLAKTITSLAEYHRAFAVGVSLPAIQDKEDKKISTSTITNLEGANFFQLLSKKIDKPIFVFPRNISLMLAEQAFGAASNYKNAVLVEIGRDISMAILINGKIYRGNHELEGQIAEMIVDITREKRNESGSFGSLVSGEGIEALTGKSVYDILKNSPNSELVSKQILRDLKESLLTGLYNVKLIIDPEAFIIHGDILENYNLFKPAIENLKVIVKKSELGYTAAALGQLWQHIIKLIKKYKDMIAEYKKMLGREFEIIIDRPLGSAHPKFDDFIYPMNYGYIDGVKAGDGDDVDVFVLGLDKPVEKVQAKIIAIIHRTNDDEDKLVGAVGDKEYSEEEIEKAIKFQEDYYKHELIR